MWIKVSKLLGCRVRTKEAQGSTDNRLARLEGEGLLRRALGPIPKELLEEAPPKPGKSLLEALIEGRRSDR